MQEALVDTVVLYGALNRQDPYHDDALPIFRRMDNGDLPVGIVLDFVYAETFNAMTGSLSHDDCTEAADILERSGGFRMERTNREVWTNAHDVYRGNPHLSFVDSALVAYAGVEDVDYIYSFDTGFDSVDDLKRIKSDANPYSA
ncbi:PIN domain-containing protein [Haladaptatus sp. F3-133]|uniref:PIN domain-containing protein n=1 Tax=Halorutilus salinus TaxID=2487751 RepID=A0A9Q4C533_9EURY|nr:PIN domain-containing protein [Halorutilus salinus]MCX2819089.1 PIN domain-containing protein [Halorutilus salinus]